MFETPIDKNNGFLKGRNKAPHPYVIYSNAEAGEKLDSLNLDIVMMGNGISYFPYLLLALINSGQSGILKERVNFEVNDIISQDRSILNKENNTVENITPFSWDLNLNNLQETSRKDNNAEAEAGTGGGAVHVNDFYTFTDLKSIQGVKINFLSPFRMKFNGRYLIAITYKDIIYAVLRRIELLSSLFGNTSIGLGKDFIDFIIKDKKFTSNLKWFDYSRYSARQKQSMKMGGLVGTAVITGSFSDIELSLLRAAELFSIGKNVSFGLGKVEIRKLIK
jgi:hypothetical protein